MNTGEKKKEAMLMYNYEPSYPKGLQSCRGIKNNSEGAIRLLRENNWEKSPT